MSIDVNLGSVREVWFASLADPNTKYSFLIRDDANSKSGAVFGRTTRLGDVLNTGPGSGWRQGTWEGGSGQHLWRDNAMFAEGSADVWSHTGRLRMWPGWGFIQKEASSTRKFDSYSLGAGGQAKAFGNSYLYLGERNRFYTGGAPTGPGFSAYKYDPDANTMTTLPATPTGLAGKGYTAIVPATDDLSTATFIYFGTPTGLWLYNEVSNTWAQDTNALSTGVEWESMVAFRDALYYLSQQSLVKRTPLAPYGVLGTHTTIKKHQSTYVLQGLTVWNNRLWYGLTFNGNKTMLATSDGVSAQTVVEMPEEFVLLKMVSHYGALYLLGGKPQAVTGTKSHPYAVSQVWKYTGSSLTKLWESNDEDQHALTDNQPHLANGAASFGPLLVWTNPGFGGTVTPRAGLMCYDAEKDAVFEGPHLPIDLAGWKNGTSLASLLAWNNTLVCSFHDHHDYTKQGSGLTPWATGVAYIRWPNKFRNKHYLKASTFKGRSVESPENVRMDYVLSSRYHGDETVQAETKTWLSCTLSFRLASPRSRIKVYAVTNERENYLIKTIDYDSTKTGWRKETFAVKNPGSYFLYPLGGGQGIESDTANTGKYLQSTFLQYRIELENTDIGNSNSTSTPEVDAIEILWMVAPTKRLQYHMRVVMQDAQLRLAGTANPQTTAQTMADRLETFWSDSLPFRMWGPFASAVDPSTLDSTNCIEVVPQVESYNNQSYRVESADSKVMQETGWTLIQNVVS